MLAKVNRRFEPLADLEIERYLCDDLEPAEHDRIEHIIKESTKLADYIQQRRQQKADFYLRQPRLVLAEPTRPLRWHFSVAMAGAAVALAAVIMLLWVPIERPATNDINAPSIRAMGSLKISLAVLRQDRIFMYREGVLLRQGDRVRLSVESPARGFLTVLGRSAGGRMDIFYDGLPTTAGNYTVPDSLVLDGELEPEDWYVILTPRPVEASVLISQMASAEPIDAAATVIRIFKEASP